jgi:hypothetical protein
MPGVFYEFNAKPYLSLIQGTLRQKVDADTQGAKKRDWETPSGEKGSKWELIYTAWEGIVKDIYIKDTEYGKFLNVEFDDAILSIGTESRYFNDFVQKLASADITKPITVKPYDFEADNGKRQIGINIFQDGKKLKNYFWDEEKKQAKEGYPTPEGDTKNFDKDDWKMHFIKVRKFLEAYAQGLALKIPKETTKEDIPVIEEPATELRVEDIAF